MVLPFSRCSISTTPCESPKTFVITFAGRWSCFGHILSTSSCFHPLFGLLIFVWRVMVNPCFINSHELSQKHSWVAFKHAWATSIWMRFWSTIRKLRIALKALSCANIRVRCCEHNVLRCFQCHQGYARLKMGLKIFCRASEVSCVWKIIVIWYSGAISGSSRELSEPLSKTKVVIRVCQCSE